MLYIHTKVRYTQFDLADMMCVSSREVVKRMREISKRIGEEIIKDGSMGCHYSYPLVKELAKELEVNYVEVRESEYIDNKKELPF